MLNASVAGSGEGKPLSEAADDGSDTAGAECNHAEGVRLTMHTATR